MTFPEKIMQMNSETRKKTILWRIGLGGRPHIADKIYNEKYYPDVIKGMREIRDAVKDEKFGIITEDFRNRNEKFEFSESQWMCLFYSRIKSMVFCVPIAEGNDFLELLTVHPANSIFQDVYWKLREEKLKLKR